MDILDSPYYTLCQNFLRALGLWPYQDKKTKFLLRVLMTTSCLSVIIPYLSKAYELRNHFHALLPCVISILFCVEFMIKFFSMIFKDNKCEAMLEQVRRDFKTNQGENLKILQEYAEQGTKINRIYSYYFMSSVVSYNMVSLVPLTLDLLVPLNETRIRAPPRLMKYNVQRFENNILVITLHGFIFDIIGIGLILGFDTLLLNCAQHACALFRIIANELKNALTPLKSSNFGVEKSEIECEDLYQRIVNTIKLHQNAIDFVNMMEAAYSTANIFILGVTLFDITLTEFLTVQNLKYTEIAFRFAIFTCGELLHILFHNLLSQRVMDHSLIVYQSCYDCEWYRKDVSKRTKNLLKLMMIRSQRPSCLTCGGFLVLGLENYAKILKASLTYFTFLSSV